MCYILGLRRPRDILASEYLVAVGYCDAPAKHPLTFYMEIHDLLYSIQQDPLSGLFDMSRHMVAKGASSLRGHVSE
jgi:hypothetical protein